MLAIFYICRKNLSKHEKTLGQRPSAFIIFECLEMPVKHEVPDIANVYAPPSFEQSPLLVIGSVQLHVVANHEKHLLSCYY